MPREPLKGFYQGQQGGMALGNALAGDVGAVYQNGMAGTRVSNELMQKYLNELKMAMLAGKMPNAKAAQIANDELTRWGRRFMQSHYTPEPIRAVVTDSGGGRPQGVLPQLKDGSGQPPGDFTMADSLPDHPPLPGLPGGAGAPPPSLSPPPELPPMGDLSKDVFNGQSPIEQNQSSVQGGQPPPLSVASKQLAEAVSDYSNMPFGKAFRLANARGEKRFWWRDGLKNSMLRSDSTQSWQERMATNSGLQQRAEQVMPQGKIGIAQSLPAPAPPAPPMMRPRAPQRIIY